MKYLFLLLSFSVFQSQAQSVLHFDKRFVECEDRWVAFDAPKDSSHSYGFIYIDAMAGLTLQVEGKFTINENGKFIAKKLLENGVYKVRLKPNNVKVAVIPASKYDELNITDPPDWLKNYKTASDSIGRMVRWGYFYNAWGECAKALTFLEKAYQLNPLYKGVEFELSYSYNALGQYEKSVTVLETAIKNNPAECLFYKELSFAEMHLGQLEKASETSKKGVSFCSDKKMKGEISYNMTYQYYKLKDKERFKYWAGETKKWAENGDQFMKNLKLMEEYFLK